MPKLEAQILRSQITVGLNPIDADQIEEYATDHRLAAGQEQIADLN